MRVLLVSEGKHEESGALESFVRRTAPKIESRTWDKVSRNDIHTHRGKGQGFFKRALRWILEAKKRGYDALVLVVDEDGRQERIGELEQAQVETSIVHPRALGMAIRSFDAWMLADEVALTLVLGKPIDTQPSPEKNRDPKEACARLLATSECDMSQSTLYAKVAEIADLSLLEWRCPTGFGVFAARLRAI